MEKASPIRTYYWTTTEGGMSQGTKVVVAYLTLREKRELNKLGVRLSKTSPYYWAEYIVAETSAKGIEEFKETYNKFRNPYYDKEI